MRSKLIYFPSPVTYAVVFDKGDEFLEGLTRFAKDKVLAASQLTAIGAFSDLTVGYFDRARKDYKKIEINEQVEVLSLMGDITVEDGNPKVHAHVVVGKSDGTAHGGHIIKAHVWPTLEVIVTESPEHLMRKYDSETGLTLINLAST